MKELSIEEKSRRYDEAIERAKSKINNDKDHVLYEDDVIEIFPELKESEDGWIKKEIINYLKEKGDFRSCWIAWLENKLKAPQNTWKPSDEQIKALHDLNLTGNISYAGQGQVLIELYNDLKKLKG